MTAEKNLQKNFQNKFLPIHLFIRDVRCGEIVYVNKLIDKTIVSKQSLRRAGAGKHSTKWREDSDNCETITKKKIAY